MWRALEDRYASTTIQVLNELFRKRYTGQRMDKFVKEQNLANTKLKSMESGLDECTLTTLFFESFAAGQNKMYGSGIIALQARDTCT